MLASHSCTLSSNTSCEYELSCTKCTIKAQCEWSLQHQTCVRKTNLKNSSLIVKGEEECPRFSAVTKHVYSDEFSSLQYIIKVSNYSKGFMNFLNESNFTCNSTTIDVYNYKIKNDEIVCSTRINKQYFKDLKKKSLTVFIYVKFNGVILLLDNVADHYVTFYEPECDEHKKDENCATCTWNYDGFAHYVRFCSFENSCEGGSELHMRHNSTGQQFWNFTQDKLKDRCAEINVTAVEPLFGTMAGNTTVTITIKNHRIFSENRNLTVSVAGTLCENHRLSGPDTITCITKPPPDDTYKAPSGPVLVKYRSDEGQELNIESSQTFQFYVGTTCGAPRPLLGFKQELYGVESGGTTVTLNGLRFVKPCVAFPARMFVKLPNGTMQFASSYCDRPVHDTRIDCRAPRLDSSNGWDINTPNFTRVLNFGLEVMNFVNNQPLYVNGPLISYYHILDNYPVVENFEIVSGGSVVVYGNHLRYIHPDVQIRFQDSLHKYCKVTSATEHSFVCMPNTTVVVSKEMFVKIDGLFTYNVTKRRPPFSTLTWYFIVLWLVVVVLALACFYQINRRCNVHKTIHGRSVHLKDLDTQTALL